MRLRAAACKRDTPSAPCDDTLHEAHSGGSRLNPKNTVPLVLDCVETTAGLLSRLHVLKIFQVLHAMA